MVYLNEYSSYSQPRSQPPKQSAISLSTFIAEQFYQFTPEIVFPRF